MIASQLVGIYIYAYHIWLFVDVHGLHGLLVESAGILIEEEPRLHVVGVSGGCCKQRAFYLLQRNIKGIIGGQRQHHQVHFVIYV